MLYSVSNLITGKSQPVTVHPNDPVVAAVDLMIEHNYSQLPVVEHDGKPLGMITSDSILRAQERFQLPLEVLSVAHARIKAPLY